MSHQRLRLFHPHFLAACLVSLCLLTACEGFFGTRTDTDFLEVPVYDDNTVAYVPVQPVITGFQYPVDIIAGWDELLYVADEGTEEIIGFDQSGKEQGRFRVPGLTAIAQDRRLDILALGHRDTTISGVELRLPAIYRIDLDKDGTYGLNNASIKKIITHPFYFKSGSPNSGDEQVSFQGIGVLFDNSYYVARNGPSNFVNQFGGPDDAIILFDENDIYQTPIFVNTTLGVFRDFFKSPKGIATLAAPPQSPAVNRTGTMFVTSVDPNTSIKVQSVEKQETPFGVSYVISQLGGIDTSRADRFINEPNRFAIPTDVAVAGDGTNYFFIVDAEKDSVYQFNGLGYEGVNPPAGLNSTKVIRASFGGTGQGLTNFNEPRGVAYLDQILYVADAGNARILRFKLTTDFE